MLAHLQVIARIVSYSPLQSRGRKLNYENAKYLHVNVTKAEYVMLLGKVGHESRRFNQYSLSIDRFTITIFAFFYSVSSIGKP